jgi:hypothetical protein
MIIHTTSPSSSSSHTQPKQLLHNRAGRKKRNQTGHGEEHGRRNCPALRLIAKPHRQHGQQHPTESKADQHDAGKNMLLRRDERDGDKPIGS